MPLQKMWLDIYLAKQLANDDSGTYERDDKI
jgi:hypothetical protein